MADDSPDALAKLIDRLLDSDRFGERWGRHWLDVVRYAESSGMEFNFTYPHAWPYRNYVIDALNQDKPYDCVSPRADCRRPDAGQARRITGSDRGASHRSEHVGLWPQAAQLAVARNFRWMSWTTRSTPSSARRSR